LPLNNVGEGMMSFGCLLSHSFSQILLPRYLIGGMKDFDQLTGNIPLSLHFPTFYSIF